MAEITGPEPPQVSESSPLAPSGGHQGLVFGAAILSSVGVIVAGICGLRTGSLVLKALALEGALVTLAVWLTLHACRIRQRIAYALDWKSEEWDEDEDEEGVSFHDVQHAVTLHYALLAGPITLLLGVSAAFLLWSQAGPESVLDKAHTATASVICLVACCLWLVLSRSFQAAGREELPEAPALMLAFRDLQWATLLVAIGILGTFIWPEEGFWGAETPWSPPEIWVARLLLVWLAVVCVEQVIRLALGWLHRLEVQTAFASPLRLLSREAVFVRGNPIASVFETIEARFGVSFRSSWAIRFVRAAALPSLILVLLLFWGLTCLTIVGTSELAVRERFGRIDGQPLGPGLHTKLPWPFGRVLRFSVKEVFTMPVGFQPTSTRQNAYLWSKEHAAEEFNLVLGDGNEAVAVNALVYYKIHEDNDRFLDYVYQWGDGDDGSRDPLMALDAYAHRALMEQTRSSTLKDVLSANRAEFAERLKQSLRGYSETNRLGIDVIDVALLTLHPPIEAAPEYLDVISAQIDAERYRVEADGDRQAAKHDAERISKEKVASAKVDRAEQIGKALRQSAEFIALNQAYTVAPEAFKLRLWYQTHEEVLADKRLIVVDSTLADSAGIIFDLRSSTQRRDTGLEGMFPSGAR